MRSSKYPKPIVTDSRNTGFEKTVNLNIIKQDENDEFYILDLNYSTDSGFIDYLIDKDYIGLNLAVSCKPTMYYKKYDISKNNKSSNPLNIKIHKNDVDGKIDIKLVGSFKKDIINLEYNDVDHFYKKYKTNFNVSKGDIILFSDGISIKNEHKMDDKSGSDWVYVRRVDRESSAISIENEKIYIDLPNKEYIIYQKNRKTFTKAQYIKTLLSFALITAVSYLRESEKEYDIKFEDYSDEELLAVLIDKKGLWVKSLALSYEKDGTGMTFIEALKDPDKNGYEIASKITEDPISGLLELAGEEVDYE